MSDVIDVNFDAEYDNKNTMINFANFSINKLSEIQMSLNTITANIKNSYTINKVYVKSIGDLNKLDTFVSRCIKFGIPSKYICYNSWLIGDKPLRGKGLYKLRAGQSRFVMYPEDKSKVIKIAINGNGILSNKTENRVSQEFINNNGEHLIAPVIKSYNNNAVIEQKRVISKKKPTEKDVKELKEKLRIFCKSNPIGFDISNDIHCQNIGYDKESSEFICFDYGTAFIKQF